MVMGVRGQGVFLHLFYIVVDARRDRKYKCNSDNSYTARECRQKRAPFFVIRLFLERANAVKNDMDGFLTFFLLFFADRLRFVVSFVYGSESDIIFPSNNFMVLVAYCSASSGLCVTIIISFVF